MGHDAHFLRRLDRVSDNHVEISLTLYRDEALLREVLSRADLPPGAERLAISLNDPTEGPFVIVTRAGKFVTCLGEGMKIGSDLVVLTRPRLDAAIAKVERMRERIARVTALEREGKDGTAQRLFKKLGDDGLRFCREDAETLIEVWPLIGRDASAHFTEFVRSIDTHAKHIGKFRFNKLTSVERRMVHHFGRLAFAASNLVVLTTEPESSEFFDEFQESDRVDARAIIWRSLFGLGTHTHGMRVLWSIGQRRKRALDPLREMRGIRDIEATLMRELGLGVVAIGTPKVRTEATKALTRKVEMTLAPGATPVEEALHELRLYAGQSGQFVRAVLDDEEASDADYLGYGRRVAAAILGHTRGIEMSAEVFEEIGEEISDDVARAILPSIANSWNGQESLQYLGMALPWLARAKPGELFLPRAFAEQLPASNEIDVALMMDGYAKAHQLHAAPTTRQAPKVGRNDPCPCGSGKKHKRCCG